MTRGFVFQNIKIQRSVGRAREGTTFPLSLKLKLSFPAEGENPLEDDPVPELDADSSEDSLATLPVDCSFCATVWVFTTISGLITIQADGTIYGINNTFSLMLFGYEEKELLGKVYFFLLFSLEREITAVAMKCYSFDRLPRAFVCLGNNNYSSAKC